jgi:hypothetical protein
LLMQDLAADPPSLIVVQRGDQFKFVTGDNSDSADALGGFPALAELIDTQYAFAERVDDFRIFHRLSVASERSGQPSK